MFELQLHEELKLTNFTRQKHVKESSTPAHQKTA